MLMALLGYALVTATDPDVCDCTQWSNKGNSQCSKWTYPHRGQTTNQGKSECNPLQPPCDCSSWSNKGNSQCRAWTYPTRCLYWLRLLRKHQLGQEEQEAAQIVEGELRAGELLCPLLPIAQMLTAQACLSAAPLAVDDDPNGDSGEPLPEVNQTTRPRQYRWWRKTRDRPRVDILAESDERLYNYLIEYQQRNIGNEA